jgi:hypothetical protein
VEALSPNERRSLLLSVGTHRTARPLSPIEVARLFEKALNAGASLQECADAAHFKATSMVSRFLSLLRLAPDIQHLVDWGQSGSTLAFTSAFELSRLPTSDHVAAASAVLANGLKSVEVRQLVQLRKRSGRSMEESVADTLGMRPTVERRHVFIGAVTNAATRDYLANQAQHQRDEMLRLAVGEAFPKVRNVPVRQGAERFTLVGDDAMASELSKTDFEAAINKVLDRIAGD